MTMEHAKYNILMVIYLYKINHHLDCIQQTVKYNILMLMAMLLKQSLYNKNYNNNVIILNNNSKIYYLKRIYKCFGMCVNIIK